MKRAIQIFLTLFLVACFSIPYSKALSQVLLNSWEQTVEPYKENNFFEVQKQFKDYWKDKTPTKGSGWKVFKRWEYFWEQRVDPKGKGPEMTKIYQGWNDYLAKNSQKQNSTLAENPWVFIGPSSIPFKMSTYPQVVGMGRINCVAFDPKDPKILWAGAAYGGVWKSTNSGTTWKTFPFTEFMSIGVTDIAVSPKDSNIVYVATGDADGSLSGSACYSIGVLKTTDGGDTWTQTGFQREIQNGFIINRILIHPTHPDTVYAATNNGLYFTHDGGVTWTVRANVPFRDIEFKADNPEIIYGSVILRNTQGALVYGVLNCVLADTTWNAKFTFPLTDVVRIAIAVTPANPNIIYALCVASDLGFHSILKSTDAGGTWVILAQRPASPNYLHENWAGQGEGGQGHYDLAIAVSRTNANEVYIGGVNIWKSIDGGTSWALNAEWTNQHSVPWIHPDQHKLTFSPTGILYAANDGGVIYTTNGGASWANISSGLEVTQFYRISSAASTDGIVFGGTQDNGTHRLLANEWKNVLGGDGMDCQVDPTNYNFVYGSLYYGDFYKSTDAGNTFSPLLNKSITNEEAGWITPFVIDPKFPAVLYAGYQNVWKSTNRGITWNRLTPIDSTYIIRAIAVAPSDPNTIYVSKQGGIWASYDAGITWTQVITGGIITGIAVSPTNPRKFWISNSGYGDSLKVYLMDGNNLTNISGSLPNVPVNCILYQNNSPDRIYIGTDVGVFFIDNRLSDWQLFNEGMPNVVINDLDIHYGSKKIRAATFGRGLWEHELIVCNSPLPKINSAKTDICQGDSVKLELSNIYKSYDWSTSATTSFIWVKTEGTYTVTVVDTTDCRYTSEPVTIIVHEIPNISIKVTGNTTICEGDSVTLQGNPFLTFTTWNWSNGQTGRTINVKESGTYTVTGTTQYGCKNTSAPVDVTVNPAPAKPTITRQGNILTSSTAYRYQWYRNDTLIFNATHQAYETKKDARYTVKVFNENDCWTLSDPIDVILGVIDTPENEILVIQPNPTQGSFNLIISNENYNKASIEISNIQGVRLITINDIEIKGIFRQTIDMNKYPSGIYFVKLKLGEKIFNKKLIKE